MKCQHAHPRHPILCIIPPHMLENIAENGTPVQRLMAEDTLSATQNMLGQRLAVSRGAVAFEPKAPAAAQEPNKQRFVYTANYRRQLPGTLVRQEGGEPSGDICVDEAYDGAGFTFDLYWHAYRRNSINNDGMPLISTVHYDHSYDNAFWDGKQMVYGDGDEDMPVDQRIFNRFTIALDVIGHELTHGVIQYESNLVYYNQPGALNESLSDVFGVLVKQNRLGQTARAADWIIGAGLFTENVNGVGIRSMKAPGTAYNDPVLGKDPQPGHMRDFVNTTQDNGGVHINSGIPNRAFYVTAFELNGFAREKAGQIWYRTMTDRRLTDSTGFQDFAVLTHLVAGEMYGVNSIEQQAVRKGWSEVGILFDTPPVDPGVPGEQPSGCLQAVLRLVLPSSSGK
jgi:Zn-dependent metalloprotease